MTFSTWRRLLPATSDDELQFWLYQRQLFLQGAPYPGTWGNLSATVLDQVFGGK